jgi:hypothetical protein
MEKKKVNSMFFCVLLCILLTNAISYVINSLEPNDFVKKHALLLLIILSIALAALTVIISSEGKVLTDIRVNTTSVWRVTARPISSVILFLILFGIFFAGPWFLYLKYEYPIKMMVYDPQTEVNLAQKYCDALERQNYTLAYSYGDYSSIQASNPSISSEEVYVGKSRLADKNGIVKSCTIKKETEISDESVYPTVPMASPYTAFDYLLDVEIIREKQPPYLIHLTIHVFDASPSGYIEGIDKL